MSSLLPGLGERERHGALASGVAVGELSDIGAVLDTATAALEEIRNQVRAVLTLSGKLVVTWFHRSLLFFRQACRGC